MDSDFSICYRYLRLIANTGKLVTSIAQCSQHLKRDLRCVVFCDIVDRAKYIANPCCVDEWDIIKTMKFASKNVDEAIEDLHSLRQSSWKPMILKLLKGAQADLQKSIQRYNEIIRIRNEFWEYEGPAEQDIVIPKCLQPITSLDTIGSAPDTSAIQTHLISLTRLITESPEYATLKADMEDCTLNLSLTTNDARLGKETQVSWKERIHKKRDHIRGSVE